MPMKNTSGSIGDGNRFRFTRIPQPLPVNRKPSAASRRLSSVPPRHLDISASARIMRTVLCHEPSPAVTEPR